MTLIQPCSAADNYEIIAAISSYSSLEYYHQAIVLDNKNNQAKHCEVTITLGAVPKAKSSCVALRDLVDEALSPCSPSRAGGSYWSSSTACPREGGGFIDEDQPPGVDEPLIGSPSFAVPT